MEIYKIYKYTKIYTDLQKALAKAEKLEALGCATEIVNIFGENWRVRYN